MRKRVFIDNDGRVVRTILASWDQLTLNTHNGDMYVDMPESSTNMENHYYCFLERAFKLIPVQPSKNHTFNYKMKVWLDPRTLDEIKAQKWNEIKNERDRLEFGGFEFEGNTYDSDQVSQGRIMGASAAGVDQIWTLADNTVVELSASQLRQLYTTLQAHIASVHERGRIARLVMESAETKEEVEAVQL